MDSNVALVSDGEFIVNTGAASKNMALLKAVNSGKAPKFSGSSQTAFLTSNIHAPTVNVHVEGGAKSGRWRSASPATSRPLSASW